MPQDIAVETLASKVPEVARQYAVHYKMKITTESNMIESIKIFHCNGKHCAITSCAKKFNRNIATIRIPTRNKLVNSTA